MFDERRRLSSLQALGAIGAPSSPQLDKITAIAAEMFGCPYSAVTLVTADRQHFKSAQGLDLTDSPRDWSFCQHTIGLARDNCLVIGDATGDQRFAGSPLVTQSPAIRFYAGAPVQCPDGVNIGALCVFDDAPRTSFSDDDGRRLTMLARLATDALASQQRAIGAEDAFEAAMAGYKLLAENAYDMVTRVSLAGDLQYVSPASFELIGYRPEEVTGRKSLEFIAPEDHETVSAFAARLPRATTQSRLEYRLIHKAGHKVWVESRPKLVRDPSTDAAVAFTDVVRDITERKVLEASIRASEARYRNLTESSRDLIVRWSLEGVVEYASPSVRTIGYEPDEVIGKVAYAFIHPDDVSTVVERLKALATTPDDQRPARGVEVRMRRADGGYVWMEGNGSVLRGPEGQIIGFANQLRDSTSRRELEQSLREAQALAEQASEAKSEFLANMSHELRTPLTSIIGYSDLLSKAAELGQGSRQYVDRVSRAAQSLLSTVNDLLDFSKLEAGQVDVRPRAIDPLLMIRETLELFRWQADDKGLTLSVAAPHPLPAAITLDPDRLRQILVNLVGNAVKFTEVGGVTAEVSYDSAESLLRLGVRDTGPGIAPQDADRLFSRFYQVDPSRSRSHAGTGLGLAICKGLTELLGGRISVTSLPGEGSRFSVDLPAPVANPAGLSPVAEPGRSEGDSLERLRILVADDNEANRQLLRVMLESIGGEVAEAVDGADAIARAAVWPADLILMDYRMPGIDGADALQAIRAAPGPNQTTPAIAVTADAYGDQHSRLLALGFDDVASKPLQPQQLIEQICNLVNSSSATQH